MIVDHDAFGIQVFLFGGEIERKLVPPRIAENVGPPSQEEGKVGVVVLAGDDGGPIWFFQQGLLVRIGVGDQLLVDAARIVETGGFDGFEFGGDAGAETVVRQSDVAVG